ncbi:hypothetical protein FQZ97_724250 [compost metagenome]
MTGCLQGIPARRFMQWRDGHRLAAIEADQGCVDQIVHFHDVAQGIDVDARALPDLRAGGRRQNGLHVDALGGEFQAHALREKQHERLGRTVHRHAELWRQPNNRADIDDRAVTGLCQAWGDGAGESYQRGGVKRDEVSDAVWRLFDKAAGLCGACIVDQDADTGVIAQAGLDCRQIADLGQVGLENIDCNAVLLTQPGCQCLQPRLVAGNQNEVMTALREALGVDSAYTSGGAGDEDSLMGIHGALSSSKVSISDSCALIGPRSIVVFQPWRALDSAKVG